MIAIIVVKQNWKGEWRRGRGAIAADPTLLDKLERMILAGWKIRLLLHPSEPQQVELVRRMDEALARLEGEDTDEHAIRGDVEAITALSQAILRDAWRRVKAGT
jgi:hypothetical protein